LKKKPTVKFLGVEGKEDVTKKNIGAIFILAFFAVSTCSDIFSNVIYLLQSPNYYGLSPERFRHVNSHAASLSSIPTFIMLILSGFIWDIIGRRFTLAILFALLALSALLMPVFSPYVGGWIFCRCLV